MIAWILRRIFGNHQSGTLVTERFFHRHNMARNITVLAVYGPVDAHVLAGAKEVLTGQAHARRFPEKKTPLFEGKGDRT